MEIDIRAAVSQLKAAEDAKSLLEGFLASKQNVERIKRRESAPGPLTNLPSMVSNPADSATYEVVRQRLARRANES